MAACSAEAVVNPQPGLRRAVARHPGLPAEAISRLAEDDDWRVREGLAGNACTDAAALVVLAADPGSRRARGGRGQSPTPRSGPPAAVGR